MNSSFKTRRIDGRTAHFHKWLNWEVKFDLFNVEAFWTMVLYCTDAFGPTIPGSLWTRHASDLEDYPIDFLLRTASGDLLEQKKVLLLYNDRWTWSFNDNHGVTRYPPRIYLKSDAELSAILMKYK